jgi:hypothetical protein
MGVSKRLQNLTISESYSLTDSNEAEGTGSYIDITASKSGMLKFVVGDYDAYGFIGFTVAGVPEIQLSSNNVFTSLQTGTNHVIIKDNGSNVRIVNELGATKAFTVEIMFTN